MKSVFNKRLTAMRKAFRKAFTDNRISDPAILERATRSDCRDDFAPESRSWDPRPRSGAISPQVSAPSLEVITAALESDPAPPQQEPPAPLDPPAPLPLPSPPRPLSPVPGPSGLQGPPRRDPSPESRCSRKRSRSVSPSSSSASASASSPSSPGKKKKHSHKSNDISKILAQLSSMRSDYATTMRSVQSRLAALESPALLLLLLLGGRSPRNKKMKMSQTVQTIALLEMRPLALTLILSTKTLITGP